MTQGDSGRASFHSVDLSQQSIYEDDGTTEHDMPYLVNLQEIDKSSSVDSISNPYQQDNGYSSATSQDSPNLYDSSSQDVGDLMDLDHEAVSQYQPLVILDDPPAPERHLATPKSNFAKLPLPSKRKPLIHHPKDCPDSPSWTDAQESHIDGQRTLAISEASQAIASDLYKGTYRSQEEMELVIKTSVLSLLSANKSRKSSPQDSPCMEPANKEKQLECQFCHKTKKTQCDLTYVIMLRLSDPSRLGCMNEIC